MQSLPLRRRIGARILIVLTIIVAAAMISWLVLDRRPRSHAAAVDLVNQKSVEFTRFRTRFPSAITAMSHYGWHGSDAESVHSTLLLPKHEVMLTQQVRFRFDGTIEYVTPPIYHVSVMTQAGWDAAEHRTPTATRSSGSSGVFLTSGEFWSLVETGFDWNAFGIAR